MKFFSGGHQFTPEMETHVEVRERAFSGSFILLGLANHLGEFFAQHTANGGLFLRGDDPGFPDKLFVQA